MLRLTAERIADAGMVGIAKVRKDMGKGVLDGESLVDIVRYIMGHRLLAGGLKVFDGMMGKTSFAGPPPEGFSEGEKEILMREHSSDDGTEAIIRKKMMDLGKGANNTERFIHRSREKLAVGRLRAEHLEELGL